jgi:hypothetical protein
VGKVPHKGKVLLLTGLTYGLMVMLLGSSPALLGGLPALLGRLSALLDGLPVLIFAFGAIAILVASASQTIFRAANNSTLLEITPRRLQGRVVGLTFLDMGAQSLAAVLAGTVTDIWNVSVGFAVIGAICLAIVALIGLGAPAVRRL